MVVLTRRDPQRGRAAPRGVLAAVMAHPDTGVARLGRFALTGLLLPGPQRGW